MKSMSLLAATGKRIMFVGRPGGSCRVSGGTTVHSRAYICDAGAVDIVHEHFWGHDKLALRLQSNHQAAAIHMLLEELLQMTCVRVTHLSTNQRHMCPLFMLRQSLKYSTSIDE
jgi:hypothetical protein